MFSSRRGKKLFLLLKIGRGHFRLHYRFGGKDFLTDQKSPDLQDVPVNFELSIRQKSKMRVEC